jgi:uncharacterized repeat protein (TIGR01451 family)
MNHHWKQMLIKGLSIILVPVGALLLLALLLVAAQKTAGQVYAAPIEPPAGYPKFTESVKVVTPTLAYTGGATLYYAIEIRNTGAYTAQGVQLTDPIPFSTTYNGDAWASVLPTPTFTNGVVSWMGEVGFDAVVVVTFSVNVTPSFAGVIQNSAIISHPLIADPVTVTAETIVADQPILTISKTSAPPKPGANKLLTYALAVTNQGQPAVNLPITVTDQVPLSTTLSQVGPDGFAVGEMITWTRAISLNTGETSVFTFSVLVDDVLSGTVLTNANYSVLDPEGFLVVGEVYTVTIIDPILYLSKYVQPDPPGSNGEMTYVLTLLNKGSQATDLVITDTLPLSVTYLRGGSFSGGIISWALPSLDTDASAIFTFTVYVGDIAEVYILNDNFAVCTAEVCVAGQPLNTLIQGPNFVVNGSVYPIAKKPGGGTSTVTPTLVLHNLGPGSALQASALLRFERISVSFVDLYAIPAVGTFYPGPACGGGCVAYLWIGDIAAGNTITFTTIDGQSTQGGEEGNHYTATLVVTDTLGSYVTTPITGTAIGNVTHYANLLPTKSGPPIVAPGQLLTYTIEVFNAGLSTIVPPYPWLTDTIPLSTTLVWVSPGGVSNTISGTAMISWTLPAMSTGSRFSCSFAVRVDDDVVSGTQIVNRYYGAGWAEGITETLSNAGLPVTTTVKEVGLIDSFKVVTPTLLSPGVGNILTYTLHLVNSGPIPLSGVRVSDLLPWQSTTYLRNAVASSGQIISDIVSLDWVGNVGPYSTELITLSVRIDANFAGVITNTATITHPDLRAPVIIEAVAYVTDAPVLLITKSAAPDPVTVNHELLYTIEVLNLGRQATNLVITDVLPANVEYVVGSASSGGQLIGSQIQWEHPVLKSGERFTFTFRVKVLGGDEIVNSEYGVVSAEGVSAKGLPVVTSVYRPILKVFLPITIRFK